MNTVTDDEPTGFTELTVRVRFSELVTYEVDRKFEIPAEIAHDRKAIRTYVHDLDVDDELADDCSNENFFSCEDRSIDSVQPLETTADHWLSDGVSRTAIKRYVEQVRGPFTAWLAPNRKRPAGLCATCRRTTGLRIGAKAALHRAADGTCCTGTGAPVLERSQVLALGLSPS
jgi:hypothetical protein